MNITSTCLRAWKLSPLHSFLWCSSFYQLLYKQMLLFLPCNVFLFSWTPAHHLAKAELQQQRELWVHWPGQEWLLRAGTARRDLLHFHKVTPGYRTLRPPADAIQAASSVKCWRDSELHITAANRESCCLLPGDLQNTTSEMVHKLPNPASSFILHAMYFFLQLDLPWLSFCKVKHGNPWPYWGLCL